MKDLQLAARGDESRSPRRRTSAGRLRGMDARQYYDDDAAWVQSRRMQTIGRLGGLKAADNKRRGLA